MNPATVKVHHKRHGICRINAADFDEKIHRHTDGIVSDPDGDAAREFVERVYEHSHQPRKLSCGADYGLEH